MRYVGVLLGLVAGCGTERNPAKCLDGHCPDPGRPFCDVDGVIGGDPGACIAVTCAPGSFAGCQGDVALTCNNTGDNYNLLACEYGCSDAAGGCNSCNTSSCEKHIIPKYLPTTCNQLGSGADLVISSDVVYDTTNALNCDSVVTQLDGPDICVRRVKSFKLDSNRTFHVSGTRVFALLADYDISIEGTLSLKVSGAGGGLVKSGTCSFDGPGGGGAGNATAGGSGGDSMTAGGAANGGAMTTTLPLTSTILLGGTTPDLNGSMFSAPGGAGGGVTVISCRGTVSVPGVIDAGGGGGAGEAIGAKKHRADGGGSGGTIVVQGMNVRVTGTMVANGGGGGGNARFTPTPMPGGRGEDGTLTTTPARGGVGFGGDGGDGGALIPPKNGFAGNGAGGGSAGFLLVYSPEGVMPMLTPAVASPAIVTGTLATN